MRGAYKRLVYVTTPGRCGSSFLMKLIRGLGHGVGGDWDDVSRSGFEDLEVLAINSEVQGNDGTWGSRSWNNCMLTPSSSDALLTVNLNIVRRIREVSRTRTVVKDAGLFRDWRLLDLWAAVTDMSIIFLWREPEQQWLSWCQMIEAKDGIDARIRFEKNTPLDVHTSEVELQREKFLSRVADRKIPMQKLMYPDFCRDPESVYTSLLLCGLVEPALSDRGWFEIQQRFQERWDEVFDPSLVTPVTH